MLTDRRHHRRQSHCRHGHPTGSLRNILFFAARILRPARLHFTASITLCSASDASRNGELGGRVGVVCVVMVAISTAATRQPSRQSSCDLVLLRHRWRYSQPRRHKVEPSALAGGSRVQLPGGAGSNPACAGCVGMSSIGCNERCAPLRAHLSRPFPRTPSNSCHVHVLIARIVCLRRK